MKSRADHLLAKDYIERLASRGRYYFTLGDARTALNVSANAATKALSRLKKQGLLASPERGFYVIVPPEYRSLGCLPAEQFIPGLPSLEGEHYYAGLLSAAQFYGAAHQRPQEFQVFLEKNRRPIKCGKVRIAFVARKGVKEVQVKRFNTPRGEILVSTPEATAIDLAGYPKHVGGLDQVATVVSELAEQIDPSLLADAAKTAPTPWAQRLGYLLELVGAPQVAESLRSYVAEHAREYTALVPGKNVGNAQRHPVWKLLINADVEPDV